MSQHATSLDLLTIEKVLLMDGGYVLDFTNATFAEFFKEHGVAIYADRFDGKGTSKANRLRCFLQLVSPPKTGIVLAALLERRLLVEPEGVTADEVERYRKIASRLGGPLSKPNTGKATTEAALLRLVFKPDVFKRLPADQAMREALIGRMEEAQRCIDANAFLAAVILCGSVLEGMCLGYGSANPERVNRAFTAQYNKPPKRLHEWKLSEWIDVLGRLHELSPNVAKFGHALRDFRNYVHPAEQLLHQFKPDAHTARIGFQVVVAAAEDLTRGTRP